jgi:hypothetical protein
MLRWQRGGDLAGTSRQGYAPFPYDRIVDVFGEPDETSWGKDTAFTWSITFDDGTVASIYDYKESSLYDERLPLPEQMKDSFQGWRIGGKGWLAVALVVRELSWWTQ